MDVHALLQTVRAAGGATFDHGGRPVDPGARWLYPRHPGQTVILAASADWAAHLRSFMEAHRPLLEQEPPEWLAFGAWIHPGGDLYLDIVTGRFDEEEVRREALRAGEREGRRVVALFQSSSGRTMPLAEKEFCADAPPILPG
ncbi:hypothetical protein [Deinococcus aestuarii]|uniref:hypothetical protein n=1 Tax=Deinococcus aestuarii TaxID=2774531 RepID=UPI001C0DDB40|nr:hypothetical protein [Deinococcus aestuarii]